MLVFKKLIQKALRDYENNVNNNNNNKTRELIFKTLIFLYTTVFCVYIEEPGRD